MLIDKKAFGRFLSEQRAKAGISQALLAGKLGYRTPQFISNWERGSSLPPFRKLRLLSSVLRISVEDPIDEILQVTEASLRSELLGKTKNPKSKKRILR